MSDSYVFTNLDSVGYDTMCLGRIPVWELMKCVEQDETAVAFNTLGYIKYKVDKLQKVSCFGPTDGLYILKERMTAEELDAVFNPPVAATVNATPVLELKKYRIPLKVINLDRRPDRWETTQKEFSRVGLEVERVSATDGKTLDFTEEIKHIFRGNDFGYRRSFIGCALSHIKLWKDLLQDPDNDQYIIFEDDIELCDDFVERLDAVTMSTKSDVLFLGYSLWPGMLREKYDLIEGDKRKSVVVGMEDEKYLGGLFGYVISKKAAKEFIDVVETQGVQNGVDRFMQYQFIKLRQNGCTINQVTPQIVKTSVAFNGNDVDSDIQRDFSTF